MTPTPNAAFWMSERPSVIPQTRAFLETLRSSQGRNRLLFFAIGLILVVSATTFGQLRLNAWNGPFFDAIKNKDPNSFAFRLAVFGIIASGLLILNVGQTWLDQQQRSNCEIGSRAIFWFNGWPRSGLFSSGAGHIGVNPDQRIHEDARRLTELTSALAIGFVQSTLLLVSFIGVRRHRLARGARSASVVQGAFVCEERGRPGDQIVPGPPSEASSSHTRLPVSKNLRERSARRISVLI